MFNWQGLGYYQRAKNMFKAIDIIKQNYPIKSYEELIKILELVHIQLHQFLQFCMVVLKQL